MEQPIPATVFTKKMIMDYLKENEVTIEEVNKVEESGEPIDFDLPQAVEDRMKLTIKIENSVMAINGRSITLNRDNNEYKTFTINSTDEVVDINDMATEPLEAMGESPIFAENIVSDMYSLRRLDEKINKAQETRDPEQSMFYWERNLKDLQDTLREDHNAYIVTLEGQIEAVYRHGSDTPIMFGEDGVERNLLDKMQEAIDKIEELKNKDPLIPAQYGPKVSTKLNLGGG